MCEPCEGVGPLCMSVCVCLVRLSVFIEEYIIKFHFN